MPAYEWTDRLSIGDETIDRQHRVLIGYINQLAEAVDRADQTALLGLLLGNLVTYTKVHFIYEEMLFHAHNYPDFEKHKHYHETLAAQVDEFKRRFNAGEADLGHELLTFLMDWLNNHILKSDLAYVEYAATLPKDQRFA